MLKKTVQYVDFNDVQQSEDFYFHLSRRELVLLNLASNHDDGMVGEWQEIMKQGNGGRIMKVVDQLIVDSYGRRTGDGQSFVKKEEWTDEFKGSSAYDVLFMQLVTNAEDCSRFFNGIVPADLAKQAQAEAEKMRANGVDIDAGRQLFDGNGKSLPVETDRGIVDLGLRETYEMGQFRREQDEYMGGPPKGFVPPEAPKSAYEQFIQSGRPFPTKKELMGFTEAQIAEAMGRKIGAEKIREEGTT